MCFEQTNAMFNESNDFRTQHILLVISSVLMDLKVRYKVVAI